MNYSFFGLLGEGGGGSDESCVFFRTVNFSDNDCTNLGTKGGLSEGIPRAKKLP